MATLTPLPFADLVRRMRREVAVSKAVFDLPIPKWFIPDATYDFSAMHFSQRASTPVGPAAGPHTQLAQNIVLSWLAGARILELKTVQQNDQLDIPRPCIHVPNVGYNVEWSQELTVGESLEEYAKAVYLIEILKASKAFGALSDVPGFTSSIDTVYDISVGYDLPGIQSEKVTGFLRAMQNPAPLFDALRKELVGDLAPFRDVGLPPSISNCVTLSTFHGCPADQIESIGRYLLQDIGLHTVIKLNPTLLGFERVRELLVDRLGYTHVTLREEAFDSDLAYDEGLNMLRRLRDVAEEAGSSIGAKFTNTLVVANSPAIFPTQREPYMYLSGKPLHVISMNLMQRFQEDVGFTFPVSFSAGIDSVNFPAAVACGMVPVTTCTDLLRQGGYGRLPRYLKSLAREMKRRDVTSREAYVLSAYGHQRDAAAEALRMLPGGQAIWDRHASRITQAAEATPAALPTVLREVAARHATDGDALVLEATRLAGRLNARDIVPSLADDSRYHARTNAKEPRTIDSTLSLYDCVNCDLCISACPNDAIFAYEAHPTTVETEQFVFSRGDGLRREPGRGYAVREAHQLAVFEGGCNECSNCEVYCPEHGAPFRVKEHLFGTMTAYQRDASLDGLCRDGNTLHARIGGREIQLVFEDDPNRATAFGQGFRLALTWDPFEVHAFELTGAQEDTFDTAVMLRMKTAWDAIFQASRPNIVNPDPPQ